MKVFLVPEYRGPVSVVRVKLETRPNPPIDEIIYYSIGKIREQGYNVIFYEVYKKSPTLFYIDFGVVPAKLAPAPLIYAISVAIAALAVAFSIWIIRWNIEAVWETVIGEPLGATIGGIAIIIALIGGFYILSKILEKVEVKVPVKIPAGGE